MSWVGALAITGYQVLYTWPRREKLVIQKIRDSGMAVSGVSDNGDQGSTSA